MTDDGKVFEFPSVTRIVVVTDQGKELERFHAYNYGVELHLQDGGRTLKLFPAQNPVPGPPNPPILPPGRPVS